MGRKSSCNKSKGGLDGSTERVDNKSKSINMNKLDLDYGDDMGFATTLTNKHTRKHSSNQVSEQRNKWSVQDIKLKLNNQNKENHSTSINSNITRRLF